MTTPGREAAQRQDSLDDQLRTVRDLANRAGCYDAADWIRAQTPRPDMHAAYLGRCVEATEVERDQAQAALTTERHRTQVAEGERDDYKAGAQAEAEAGDEARREVGRLREALRPFAEIHPEADALEWKAGVLQAATAAARAAMERRESAN